MPILFPVALDNFTNPTAADNLNAPTVLHSAQHANINDAVEALQAKVGVNGSAVATSHDYKIAQLELSKHDAVTLGTASGLSLLGQALSLGLASSGVTGALSGTDWDAFNAKQSALSFPLSPTLGGTGVNNGTNTLTVPATGTAALLAIANQFTAAQSIAVDDAINNASTNVLTLKHTTTGTAAVNIATGIDFQVEHPTSGLISLGTLRYYLEGTGFTGSAGVCFSIRQNGTVYDLLKINSAGYLLMGTGVYFGASATNQGIFSSAGYESFLFNNTLFRINNDKLDRDFTVYGLTSTTPIIHADGALLRFGVGTNAPAAKLHVIDQTTTTNAVLEVGRIEARVSTAATGGAAGFGAGLSLAAETATDGTSQLQGMVSASWIDATNATRKAKLSLSAYDTAARLGIEIEADGSAVKLGFFGGTTTIQQILAAYTTDSESIAYTGIDNAQVGTVYATVADLNLLRAAYETLRASYDDLRTKLQTSTLVA